MDPGRLAMIQGHRGSKSPTRRPDISSPRHDSNNRITKPTAAPRRPNRPGRSNVANVKAKNATSSYLTEDQQAEKFVADEDQFVLKQAKKAADIRVREGRPKPADLLAFNLRFVDADGDPFDDHDSDVELDVPAPTAVVESLGEDELGQLDDDITSFHTLEPNKTNQEYWTALRTLSSERCQKLKSAAGGGGEERAVGSVSDDIDKVLRPKTLEQLEKLEGQVKAKLSSDEVVDTDYWAQVSKRLLTYKAKAKINSIYDVITTNRIQQLQARNPEKARLLAALAEANTAKRAAPTTSTSTSNPNKSAPQPSSSTQAEPSSFVTDIPRQPESAIPPGTERFSTSNTDDFSSATKALYDREVARGVNEDEEIFAAEEILPPNSTSAGEPKPQWAEKYRPRKPRYFNRVQMGYEWNKYNQTHYDHDNPPPKVVQGYKFNIFYPDLIDQGKAPTFKIVREGGRRRGESLAAAGEEDTCLIRFVAGPPYEDIAFRIVDREWDYSSKRERGFRSTFDKGILQLHFQFKKIYYRK